ncbi:unnamed protein product [Bursaphelenchus xylophilus]|uniref:(pine wood nematode) hypothetical protein n=1 Tax=Bursaphelenchus xylophilus TaxID=6326 RepID=A0A1I7S0N1_BURXY|nr:unnamed protein product [Bursaphelenchus xylophilus]CAG9132364.1 unnamed protein product [Bursaphelenchus xylophilus]
MGSANSHHPEPPMAMEQPLPYPDMNVIFKGIPKMMQVADDMHVLTEAITDMRNMTLGMVLISMVGMCIFLVLKYMQTRRNSLRRRRRLQNQTDSERSSLTRPYRQYNQKPMEWTHHKVDMDKLLENNSSQSSTHTPPGALPKARVGDFTDRVTPPLANGTAPLKRLDPVKLMIDEVPYVDSSEIHYPR